MSIEIRKALLVPGPVPSAHYAACAKLRREWPTLWKALARSLYSNERRTVEDMADRGDDARLRSGPEL